MPFWLKAVLAVAGVVIAAGVLWYGYRRFLNSLPAYRRRQIRNKRDY